MSEEERLARNIQVLSYGKLEEKNLDTCITYGISGLCGKECPKFKDKTCEVYLDTLEREYNSLQNQLQQKESKEKEIREWAKKYSCQFTNDDGELVVSEISFNIQARPCDLFKILDKEVN